MSADRTSNGGLLPQAVAGMLIIVVGLVLTAGNLGWVHAKAVLAYWPVGLIVLGASILGRHAERSARAAGAFITVVGVLLTVGRLLGWHFNAGILWPLILVAMGIAMLFRGEFHEPIETSGDERLGGFVFWSGTKRQVTSQMFSRADFTAVMGGVQLDLRNAATAGGEAVVDLFVVMGGLEIRVPPDWVVSNQIVVVMGGVDDKSTGTRDSRNRLVLRGFVMMGGVEVKS